MEAHEQQRSPDARPAVLYPFIAAWILYGVAIVARVMGESADPMWESVQRYAFVAALGFLTRYKAKGMTMWVALALAVLSIGAVAIEGNDPVTAAMLAGVFAVAVGVGQFLRSK